MIKRAIAIFLFLFNTIIIAQTLDENINQVLQNEFPHAIVGVLVKNATTGEVIYQRNAKKRLMPGSGVKLFTAAASFYHFKADHVFSTRLLKKGNHYYIQFSGAPDFSSEQLEALIANLKKAKKISGNLYIDTSRFEAPYYPSGITFDDLGWYYAAPDTAAIIDGNEASFQFITAKKPGAPVKVKPLKKDNGIRIINQLKTVSPAFYRKHCSMHIQILPDNQLKLFGCLPQRKQAREMRLAVTDPIFRAKQLIMASLKKHKIQVQGQIKEGKTPAHAGFIASTASEPLSNLLQHMLWDSDNLYANSMTKQLGFALTNEGRYKQGIFAIKKILSTNSQLNMDEYKLADGMGSRYNLISPHQMVDLLTDIYDSQSMRKLFFEALPQAAVSGTLADRMKHSKLAKRVYAKTGTMHDVSSLSGFWLRENKAPLIFSIMFNDVNRPIYKAKVMEEKLLLMMQDS
jgi:D-alanyl-D-alanine carboxypeptidase/D-alanyl-D-alanine-endopeptidase (penicillin-binding protein 4)